jgi:23S rRNA (guanosine2251-2'-O)-methyltransferase
MFLCGRNVVREALASGTTINKLMVDKNLQHRKDDVLKLASEKRIKVEYVDKFILDKKANGVKHQGFIAESVEFKYTPLEEMLNNTLASNKKPFFVMLDGIEDPHNFGAIIRSCECAGVDGIIIPKNRACMVNETVIRTSTGAISNMPISIVTNLKDAVNLFKDNGIWTFVAETGGENIYNKKLGHLPIAVIIGSEGKGVKQSLRDFCDGIITLPLQGKVNSLNASVACGIVIFEILRQRGLND